MGVSKEIADHIKSLKGKYKHRLNSTYNSVELKPCPFCGGKPYDMETEDTAWIACQDCEAGTDVVNTYEEAVKLWNKRIYE